MKSRHGGSEGSGLVLPMGLEKLQPHVPEGMVLVPQEVVDARNQAAERHARAVQLERRRLGLEILSDQVAWQGVPSDADVKEQVAVALKLADELMAQTGGGI